MARKHAHRRRASRAAPRRTAPKAQRRRSKNTMPKKTGRAHRAASRARSMAGKYIDTRAVIDGGLGRIGANLGNNFLGPVYGPAVGLMAAGTAMDPQDRKTADFLAGFSLAGGLVTSLPVVGGTGPAGGYL